MWKIWIFNWNQILINIHLLNVWRSMNEHSCFIKKSPENPTQKKKNTSVIITFLNGTKKEKSSEMIEKACGLAHGLNFPWASFWGDSHCGTRHLPKHARTQSTGMETSGRRLVQGRMIVRRWLRTRVNEDQRIIVWAVLSKKQYRSFFFPLTGWSLKCTRTLLKRVGWQQDAYKYI